ncbi:uncharacterized protein STEHIDRAFT_153796 [Stereum hirsutum FP-91666 SS1]|uniref:uncharacterized protein n=1 Tax=Stereum hirsutum (strain FP-91666) TaxID=721885 RepID=UPI000440D9A3|nr:uncharacterized protein STEHIDRAFT_153796 [Stereum hirsutum FP-91666 SS1]EIM89959.1 hypothetical protein STEHIDRAFT_153796 [Stereum hirsutum FP-91666 SS1]
MVLQTIGNPVMGRMRTYGHRFFRRLGIHCATHQIRLLLISAIVITSLLYPALAIYSSSQPRFLAQFSSQILDPFLSPEALSTYYAQRDIRDVWTGQDNIYVREDSVARARCGMEQTIRVEHVLIHGHGTTDETGALNHQTLLSTLALEQRISKELASQRIPCLLRPDGQCLVISPLQFWQHNEKKVLADFDILDTLGLSKNVSIAGLSVSPHMVTAGREIREYPANKLDFAMFLVLTYFFPETNCLDHSGHDRWGRLLRDVAKDHGEPIIEKSGPKLIALEYKTRLSSFPRLTVLSGFLYTAYFVFFILFSLSMRLGLPVHSGPGLVFTGLVELGASTVTSLSVCALAGFRITMVPWEIFPLVIIFVGTENMFRLVEAVVATPVTLPVKERVAEGLSRAGTSNTLKVLTYNIILGVIAFFSQGTIRQFCAFAVVVLVAHWFLVHTLFVTVVSIDLQRLELEELLQQNTSISTGLKTDPPPKQPKTRHESRWDRLTSSLWMSLVHGRATKNVSLVMLLATTGILYFATYPAGQPAEDLRTPLTRNAISMRNKSAISALEQRQTPSWQVWHTLNQADDPLLHLRIESPSIIMLFPPDMTSAPPNQSRPSFTYRSQFQQSRIIRTLVWLLRIVVLPITLTVLLLYTLLLYLLKDTDRLEAQRHRAEPSAQQKAADSSLDDLISFATLPRAMSSDVELLAGSRDGRLIASVGLENEVVLWSKDCPTHTTIDASDVLLKSASTSSAESAITALAVNDFGTFCAVGTGAGVIALWALDSGTVRRTLPHLVLQNTSSSIVDLHFLNTMPSGVITPGRMGSLLPPETPATIVASYANGIVVRWDTSAPSSPQIISPSWSGGLVSTIALMPLSSTDRLLAAFAMEDGALELAEITMGDPLLPTNCRLKPGNPSDPVVQVFASCIDICGGRQVILAAATQAGVVTLWDATTCECIAMLDDIFGQINHIRLCPIYQKTCPHCGELPVDSFSLSLSVGHTVLFYRIYTATDARKCSCTHNQPPLQNSSWSASLGRRSRTASFASAKGTPSRSRHSSLSDGKANGGLAYPISGHGILSRRAPDKDILKRGLDTLPITLDVEEHELPVLGPMDMPSPGGGMLLSGGSGGGPCPSSAHWRNMVVVRVATRTFERGRWDVVDDRILGVRRRSRSSRENNTGGTGKMNFRQDYASGLSASALERWEVWTFDPSTSKFSASLLAGLQSSLGRDRREIGLSRRSPPSTVSSRRSSVSSDRFGWSGVATVAIPRLPFTRVSAFAGGYMYCLAGFGNTVGVLGVAPSKHLDRNLSARLTSRLRELS